MKRFFWVLNLSLVAAGAWLVAGIISTLIAHSLRPTPAEPVLAEGPSPRARRAGPRKDNKIIVKKNLFGSAIIGPMWNACDSLPLESTWMLGKPVSSIRCGFEFPDNLIHSHFRDCKCSDHPMCAHGTMKCAQVRDATVYERHIQGLKRPGTELFFCRPQRLSWQESNIICIVADGGRVVHWKHLWEQDGDHRRVLAQGGEHPDGTCAWLSERYVP